MKSDIPIPAGEDSTAEEIVLSSGIKLVARGLWIAPSVREKLRELRPDGTTLEQSFSSTDGVNAESLAVDMGRIIDNDVWFKRLDSVSGDPGALRHGASFLRLPHEILSRLTVARDQRPTLYRHLLSVAIITHYLALRLQLKPGTTRNLLMAALCHDLGELYIDPAILATEHRVTDEERRFIYVHPIVGWLIVRDLPGVDAVVATAILQHQERLDGSGYPNSRKGDAIGLEGRILAAADVSASIMARYGDYGRLSMLLRLNLKKYDPKIVGLFGETNFPEARAGRFERDTLSKQLTSFGKVLNDWARFRTATGIAQRPSCEFLSERMFNLRTIILQFGFDPDSIDMPLKLAEEDATIAAELTAAVWELRFQLADLGREFDRRFPELRNSLDSPLVTALEKWRGQLQDCITT